MLTLILAAALAADDPAADLEAMEGTWVLTSMTFEGKAPPPEGLAKVRLEVRDGRFTFRHGPSHFAAEVTDFEPLAEPRAIDLTRERDKQTLPGIYKLEGDTLTLCTASRGGRPADFSAGPGSPNLLRVYRRARPGE
jgi:uncharacterized protein (TIGR03067 family)